VKIECIRTYRLSCPLPEILGYAQGRFDSRQALLVQIVADDGAEGWGECAGPAAIAQAAVTTYYGPRLIGQDPTQTDLVWHNLWRVSMDWARRGMMLSAMSGLDMAMWDLRGRSVGRSVAELIGGRSRERVPCYATGLYFRDLPEADLIPALIDEAFEYVEKGYRALKVQIGRNLPFDTALIRALRKALPTTPLFADANHAYDLPEAIQIGRVLEEANFAWFEEPLSPDCGDMYQRLAQAIRVPLASGKREQTRWGFRDLLAHGGVHVGQPDIAYCGGLSEAVRIRAVANSYGINVSPHTGGRTMLGLSAALHFLACDHRQPGRAESAVSYLEVDAPDANPLRDALFCEGVPLDHGVARVPSSPGLGVTVDWDIMRIFTMEKHEITDPA
jgi:D-galactarolactone cycloisomerase